MKTKEMEIALFDYLKDKNIPLAVPNVSWGFLNYEADILYTTNSHYLNEIEIKVSRSDLRADKNKKHEHDDPRIKSLYFAIPKDMKESIELIPEKAGVLLVSRSTSGYSRLVDGKYERYEVNKYLVRELRKPKQNRKAEKLGFEDLYRIARLGTLRSWSLKRKLLKEEGWYGEEKVV